MRASYASTGAAGSDYEVDLAASLFARLLAGGEDRMFPEGFTPYRVSLQHRDGPDGFDDVLVTGNSPKNEESNIFIQARRSFSVGDNDDFRKLAKAIWRYDLLHEGPWYACIAAGEITPRQEDIVTLTDSARSQPTAVLFEQVWRADGVLNEAKRTVCEGLKSALHSESEDARWRVLRRLRIVVLDYHITSSRDRHEAIRILGDVLNQNQDPRALFSTLRDLALRRGKLAASFSRNELVAELSPSWSFLPNRPVRNYIATLKQNSQLALNSIETHLSTLDGSSSLSLIRAEIVNEARAALTTHHCVRIVGEGGSGKSAVLKRLALAFPGPILVLKDDRIQGRSWDAYSTAIGLGLSATELAMEFATRGPCLLAIDGADRLLLSDRRGVLEDILRAIANSPLRANWSVVTSARDFQGSDRLATALGAAGLKTGPAVPVGAVTPEDAETLARALPGLAGIVLRSDLADRNRVLFLLKGMLMLPQAQKPYTEATLAAAWSTRGADATRPNLLRDAALSRIGDLLVERPHHPPQPAEVDAGGLRTLLHEGAVSIEHLNGAISLTHDVYLDWLLARAFGRRGEELPSLLRRADEPLLWTRALRIHGQTLLEANRGVHEWLKLLSAIDADKELDPAWGRTLLVAPLYSERSRDVLQAIESMLLADGAALLKRVMETLLVYEVRLNDHLLRSDALAAMDEITRLRTVASFPVPHWRSWGAFLGWSVQRWRHWPTSLVPLLARIAAAWNSANGDIWKPLTHAVVAATLPLLHEVEDAQHPKKLGDRRAPFDLNESSRPNWDEVEQHLRRAVATGVTAAPELVKSYVERLTTEVRLRSARSDLLEHNGKLPKCLPRSYADMAIKHFTPRLRLPRLDKAFGSSTYFSISDYHRAGIEGHSPAFWAGPDPWGFSALFVADEAEALRLFHRLEMRASVFLRHYWRIHDSRKARPCVVATMWGEIPLWGDESIYRWARGLLGPDVLGSCYMALDDWINEQADRGRPITDLSRLVLRRNGLVATAAPLICALARHANDPNQIDGATPFLSTPRLWDYDLRRFNDDQAYATAKSSMAASGYFDVAERVGQRYTEREFLAKDLLLPFQLTASEEALQFLQDQRANWTHCDLAAYDDEVNHPVVVTEHKKRIARITSDTDPQRIRMERTRGSHGIRVQVVPPENMVPTIETFSAAQTKLDRAIRLSNWVVKSRDGKAATPIMTIVAAIQEAQELEELEGIDDDTTTKFLWYRFRASSILGTASIAARFGTNDEIETHLGWIRSVLIPAAAMARASEDDPHLINDAVLFNDPRVYSAEAVAALNSRGYGDKIIRHLVMQLSTNPLLDVAEAAVRELDWRAVPDLAWYAMVAALDMCVQRHNRPWINGDSKRATTANARHRKRASASPIIPWLHRPRRPIPPKPPYKWVLAPSGSWVPPYRWARARSGWLYNWTRASRIFNAANFNTISEDAAKRRVVEDYLRTLVRWTHSDVEDPHVDGDTSFLYEWGRDLATTLGRFAAVAGSPDLWEELLVFQEPQRAVDLAGNYLEAVTEELVKDGRAPDGKFWSVWRPVADWIMETAKSRGGGREDYVPDPIAAAGFVGPFTTPIPHDWPHLEDILPTVDRWVRCMISSKRAASAVLLFAERLSLDERETWLLPWVADMVAEHRSDHAFWSYGSIGDIAAGLLAPLETRSTTTRREVRRVLSFVADAGSLGAREMIPRFDTTLMTSP